MPRSPRRWVCSPGPLDRPLRCQVMADALGLIPVPPDACSGSPGALDRLLGAPLVLWAVNNLRRAMPIQSIVVACDDERVSSVVAAHGVRCVALNAAFDAPGVLVHDVFRPFCELRTVRWALERGVRELESVRARPIEQIRIGNENDFELARAVAAGLPTDHPCVVGVRRLRLPLAVEVQAVICDVDGVLTDGQIHIDSAGVEARQFHVHDGMGTRLLQEAGVAIGWLSSGADDGVIRARATRLGVAALDVGEGDKGKRFARLCKKLKVEPAQTLYLGDDVNDLPAMSLAALTACPSNAARAVRAAVDLVLDAPGGSGCFRELADLLLDEAALREAQGVQP